MIRSAPLLRTIAVCAVLAHVWVGFAFCRADDSSDARFLRGVPCHGAAPCPHDGHEDHESEHSTPWGDCPAPDTPHSHDLVLAVFSSYSGPAPRHFGQPAGDSVSSVGDAGAVSPGPDFDARTALLFDNVGHLESRVPTYARFEVFLL